MCIGENIDPAMAANPPLISFRKKLEMGRGRQIRQEISHPKLRVGLGQIKMCQPIHLFLIE
jgi:hypothetical protein